MKRLIPIILCVMLVLTVCVSAAETEEEASALAVTGEFSMPEGLEPPTMPEDGSVPVPPDGERMAGRGMGGGRHGGGQPPQMQDGGMGMMPEDFQQQSNTQSSPKGVGQLVKEYQTPIISVILLLLAFPFVIFYRRKNY